MEHTIWEGELPAPRLQLRWMPHSERTRGYNWECHYELVMPLDKYDIRAEQYDENDELMEEKIKEVVIAMKLPSLRESTNTPCGMSDGTRYYDSPFRDGAHAYWDAKLIGNLPIFVIAPDGMAFKRGEE